MVKLFLCYINFCSINDIIDMPDTLRGILFMDGINDDQFSAVLILQEKGHGYAMIKKRIVCIPFFRPISRILRACFS